MGSVSVSSCTCCMFVYCVYPVAVLNAAFCMTFSLLMLVEDTRGILQSRSHDCLICSHECLLPFPNPDAVNAFIICRGVCTCTEML